MFDPVTTALIASGPALEGVSLDDLPQRFTGAFADIVAARIRLRENPEAQISEELAKTLHEMKRLAAAQEALVALLPEKENRGAAAFIAATAHQAFAAGAVLRAQKEQVSYIDIASVSEDVCATLLFMVAEAFADAAEASKAIKLQDGAPEIERALLLAIKRLAKGELRTITNMEMPQFNEEATLDDQAQQSLLFELFNGIRHLSARLLNRVDVAIEMGGVPSPRELFEKVKQLCVEEVDDFIDGGGEQIFSLFPGASHLASLLISVERDLMDSAITRIPTPGGVDENGWWQVIGRIAGQRPYLWKNHRQAIASGYLEQGISSAVSFPTGGGQINAR